MRPHALVSGNYVHVSESISYPPKRPRRGSQMSGDGTIRLSNLPRGMDIQSSTRPPEDVASTGDPFQRCSEAPAANDLATKRIGQLAALVLTTLTGCSWCPIVDVTMHLGPTNILVVGENMHVLQ